MMPRRLGYGAAVAQWCVHPCGWAELPRTMPTMTAEEVPVWVVDDQISFRRAAAATLAATTHFVMVGECDTGEAAIELTRDAGRGLVLMDICMPGIGGIEASRRIHATQPDLTVLLMSTYDIADLPDTAVHCGAAGYLHKERLSPDLLSKIWHQTSRA
jgi:two-component system, NarL family, invasion response regulator UvrY